MKWNGLNKCLALALAVLGLVGPARAGSVSYLVTANTTGRLSDAGFLELQLNPSTPPASATVTATISNFSSDGSLGSVSINTGVTGSFSSTPAVMDNTTLGDLQQNFTYGKTLSFELTLSGSEINNTTSGVYTGTILTFILEDSGQNGLNTGPLAGEAVDIYVNPNGAGTGLMVDTYPPASGNYPSVTVSPFGVVPEPSSVILLGLGAGAVLVFGRRRMR